MSPLAVIGPAPFDTALLASALVLTAPILLAAVGELISERAGVLNVGLEGMMLSGAFFSYLVVWKTDSLLLGVLAGIAAGLVLAAVMAVLTVDAGADQIVSGVGINLAAIGLTSFLFDQIFGSRAQEVVPTVGPLAIPALSAIPDFGPALFKRDPLLYVAFLSVPAAWYLLYRTKWGLAIRATGEMPAAVDTAGISVRRLRWYGVFAAGGMSGLAGAYLAIVEVGIFKQQMSAGRGFLALVAVIFGRWRPWGVLGACLILGGADALQLRLVGDRGAVPGIVWGVVLGVTAGIVLWQVTLNRGRTRWLATGLTAGVAVSALALLIADPSVDLPAQLWRSLPFLLALIVLAGALTRAHMPSKLTIPYHRGES